MKVVFWWSDEFKRWIVEDHEGFRWNGSHGLQHMLEYKRKKIEGRSDFHAYYKKYRALLLKLRING